MHKPQRTLTWEREDARFVVLNERILALPRADQERKAWRSVDRHSSAFVSSLPCSTNVIGNGELPECFAMYFGLESPACRPLVGQLLKGQPLDKWGNLLTTLPLEGDGWRTAHDSLKWLIFDLLREATVEVRCEVLGLFSHLISQQERFNGLPFRIRNACVPDFMVQSGDGVPRYLADVKRLHCGCSPINAYGGSAQNFQCGAVAHRQRRVHPEYHKKAKEVDVKYNSHDPLSAGMSPVQSALDQYGRVRGFVVGAFGEISTDLDALIGDIGALGAARGWREMGAISVVEARAVLTARARRCIGIEAVRGHARLKIDRLASLSGDSGAGSRRRTQSHAACDARRRAYAHHRGPRVWGTSPRRDRDFSRCCFCHRDRFLDVF